MKTILTIKERNNVLSTMAKLIREESEAILTANKQDLEAYSGEDLAMEDRLKVNDAKIDGMINSLEELASQKDPLGQERFHFTHDNGMEVSNKTAPFGTVMIIYESRPDVTVEAAGIAFKSGNKILLKGGKESLNSNLVITDLWHRALAMHSIDTDWMTYLKFNRQETQEFLANPTEPIDLIVPRGGERLIAFVKEHATCPVVVSGRGNNFVYVHKNADKELAKKVILNAKTAKISACNALDKVLIDKDLEGKTEFLNELTAMLQEQDVEILTDEALKGLEGTSILESDDIWYKEFLDYKIVIGETSSLEDAVAWINKYSGGHSSSIITTENSAAEQFMINVDAAAVYHNASTRFTDGGQLGLGGELAISTDKLHQRGPIGLQHLVTNKWYIHGAGQIR
ncbi:glutamate-5-semialdehyde dehydrogenase [Robertkochia sediminum]|uniref:glutamate-5-semialdehyde dehydrogenase n=1 Tax=Robertkochia sediminum TaxID=2785326 RepID=UPI00193497F6|nr:glutamate-5-semialdehyde dehydrogenase [Robertkochia sediminum]MBL7473343.1 glutamate-5-semialdehyde dehydrogenase [Robertkochia sediminum]